MPNPSPTELKLLRHLWQEHQLSAREIHERTSPQTNWSYSTTRKTLDRMQDKGLITTESVHGLKIYSPVVTKLDTMAGLITDFAKNILDTDTPLPAATFANSKMISKQEVKELRELLQKLQEETENE